MKKGQYQPPDTTRPALGGKEGFDALFEHARRDAFTPEEAERLWQNVMAAGPGTGDVGPEIPEGPMRGWTSGTAMKAAAFVAAGGLLVAAFVARRPSSRDPIAVPSGAPATSQAGEAPGVEGGPPVVSWEDLPRAHGPGQGEARPAPLTAPRGRNPSVPSEPARPPAAEASSAGSASTAPNEPDVAPPPPAASPSSPSEGALLLRARQQLVSDPSAALELTDEAGRRFPDGALAPEREVLAIEALARLDRLPSARARFAAFRARYPRSPHLARLQSLVSP